MSELTAGLEALAEQYPTVPARLLVSLVAFAGFALLSWVANRFRRSSNGELRGAITDLVASLVVAGGLLVLTAILIGVWGQTRTVAVALEQANVDVRTLGRVLLTVGLIAGTFVFVRFVRHLIRDLLSGHDAVSEHQLEVTYRITQVAVYLLAGLIVLGFWQVDLSGLLIGAGVLGIVLGMAAQQTLASIFAGFVLMFSRPFEIGDWVRIGEDESTGIEGIVSDITIISTRIQTADGEYAILPNDEVSSRMLINYSRKGRLRLSVSVGVDYGTDLDRAQATVRETIRSLEEIMRVPTPQVVVTEFAESAIVLEIRFWINKPSSRRRWRAKHAVIKAINDAFDREGIKIPFPQRELSGRTETGGFRIADEHRASEPAPQANGSGRTDVQRDPTDDRSDAADGSRSTDRSERGER
ncbi:mechanosensitive ion channel family protein [Halalkalicoccus ordinarius]|uniref:mechanosensitive ion channel family protein n=1 Tax=Halalkalicoccus ordinarius TaxID=3116651 RepID=UPI00300F0926